MRSREEEEELERRTKKVKENHSQGIARFPSSPRAGGERGGGGGEAPTRRNFWGRYWEHLSMLLQLRLTWRLKQSLMTKHQI